MHMKRQNMSGQTKLKQEIYSQAVDYYRQRPDEFCEDLIGIRINVYQKVMLRCIFKYDWIMFIMCRTWLGEDIPSYARTSNLLFAIS